MNFQQPGRQEEVFQSKLFHSIATNVQALVIWWSSLLVKPEPVMIKVTKVHFYSLARRYSSAETEADLRYEADCFSVTAR
jgi:hypothetical protein